MPSLKIIGLWVLVNKFVKIVSIYRRGGHLMFYKFMSPLPKGNSTWKLALIGQAISEKKRFENNGHIHVYSPRAGSEAPLVIRFFKNINLVSIWSFAASFSNSMTLTVSPIQHA